MILVHFGTFEYIPKQGKNPILISDKYAFIKCKPKPSDAGNIS